MKLSSVARRSVFTGTLVVLAAVPIQAQETEAVYRTPPPELAALVDAPPAPGVSLGPDGQTLLIMTRPGAPSIAEVSAPELRLAGLRINPRNNGPSRGSTMIRLAFQSLDGDERPVTGLPDAPRIADVRWSPDGAHVAFSLRLNEHIELWVAAVESGEARKLMDPAHNAAYVGSPFGWVSDGQSLLARTIPADRGPAPAEAAVPTGPVIQETTGEAAPNRTYQDLLQNPHDERVFEHYATSQLVRVDLEGNVTPMGVPALIGGVSPSPDGTYALVQTTPRPYSYLVPASRFPTRIEVWDMDGTVVSEIADLPLQDKVPTGFGSVPTGERSISWRADAPATLVWTEALDGGDANAEAEDRDRVAMLAAPFTAEPTTLATLPLRFGGVMWSEDGFALVAESWFATREVRMYEVDPDAPGEQRTVFEFSMEDSYGNPGSPMLTTSRFGTSVLRTADGGRTLFLTGQGASPEGNRPFLRKMDRETGDIEEVFRSEAPYYEMPVELIDD